VTITDEHTVYADPKFRHVDVGRIMRYGHPDIAEGDEHIVAVVQKLRAEVGRPLRIIDVGSGSGDLSLLLAQALPDCTVIANDTAPNPAAQAGDKLADLPNASVHDGPFEQWTGTADVVISWGSHHHMAHDYLDHVREVLSPEGVLIVGDEFCPEYLTEEDRQRLARATEISIVDGYIFDSAEDIQAYRDSGEVPQWSRKLEDARRRTLWNWYKFVCDYALEKESWDVLLAELAICRDDLVTDFADEHKTSPYLLERELELNGFTVTDKKAIGERARELQSFVVYTARPVVSDNAA
jgi:SAM-dependent methyltransferase